MRHLSKAWLVLLTVALLLGLAAVPAFAQEVSKNVTVGKANVVVFAPTTVWQGTNAHVVIKVTNTGTEPLSDFKATLTMPKGQDKNITYKYKTGKDGVDEATFKNPIKPGETAYTSFTYLNPKTAMPIGEYQGSVAIASGGQTQTVPWNLSLREGTRYQASTGGIVVAIMGLSLLTMIGWFVYFKIVVNPAFVFFKSPMEGFLSILVVVLFLGLNMWPSIAGMLGGK